VSLTVWTAVSCAYRPLVPEAELVPTLCRDRIIRTRPLADSAVSMKDTESIVYVPGDDDLWIADDNSDAAFEIDRQTGQFRERVTASDIVQAFPEAGMCDDGDGDPRTRCSYTEELEVVAYDSLTGTLFLFNTVNHPGLYPPVDKPAVYRLRKRHGRGLFQLVDWRELPTQPEVGPAVVIEGKLYLATGGDVIEYDVERKRPADSDDRGNPVPVLTVTTEDHIVGMAFDGRSLWVLTHGQKMVQVEWDSKAVVASYDVAPFEISEAKGLGFGAGEFFVVDGDAPNFIHVLRFGTRKKLGWWRGGGQSPSCG
jgi:hypothetical protein